MAEHPVNPSLWKRILSPVLKIGIAAALIFWLVSSGRLDLTLLSTLLVPRHIVVLLTFVFISIFINNWRWKVLLNSQNIPCSFSTTLPLTFIGLFFNYAMPGGVGGDVVKGYYLLKDNPDKRLASATSVFMDRLIGFFIMTFLAVVALLFDFNEIVKRPALLSLSFLISGLFLAFCLLFSVAFSRRISNHRIWSSVYRRVPGGHVLEKVQTALLSYRSNLKAFFAACGLSIISQVFMVFFFIYGGHALSAANETFNGAADIPWQTYAISVPIGMIATAMPISLAGIGVGQVVFMKLFNWNLGYDTPLAAAIITAYQIAVFMVGLVGVYFFLRRKAPAPPAEVTV